MAVDAAFQRWAEGKGALVLGFVSAVREACLLSRTDFPGLGSAEERRYRFPADHRGYFDRVLRDMLA